MDSSSLPGFFFEMSGSIEEMRGNHQMTDMIASESLIPVISVTYYNQNSQRSQEKSNEGTSKDGSLEEKIIRIIT